MWFDFVSPHDLTIQVDSRNDGRAEHGINSFAIRYGRGAGVAAAGTTAKIGSQPRSWWNDGIPESFPVAGRIAQDVVLRNGLCPISDRFGPTCCTNEDAIVPDDWAGM